MTRNQSEKSSNVGTGSPSELRVGEHAGEIVARPDAAAILQQLAEVGPRLGQEAEPVLARVAFALELRILDAEVLVRDLEHEALALARDAEHLGDHAQRLHDGDVLDEIDLAFAAAPRQLVEELVGDGLEATFEAADGARREPVADHGPVVAVLGWIHVDQHAQRRVLLHRLFVRIGQLGEEDEAPRAAEELRLFRDLDDVGVLGHRPEGAVAGRVEAVQRRFAPQPGPRRVRVAVLAVALGGDDVEIVEGNRWVGHCRVGHGREGSGMPKLAPPSAMACRPWLQEVGGVGWDRLSRGRSAAACAAAAMPSTRCGGTVGN